MKVTPKGDKFVAELDSDELGVLDDILRHFNFLEKGSCLDKKRLGMIKGLYGIDGFEPNHDVEDDWYEPSN